MLNIVVSKKKPKAVITYSPPIISKPSNDPVIGAIFETASKRNKIVQDLFKECQYKVGDTVVDKEGNEYLVHHMCETYAALGKDYKWPDNNNPMIITIKALKTNTYSFCTINYVVKK